MGKDNIMVWLRLICWMWSRGTVSGAVLGALFGTFLVPIIGTIIGLFFGTLLGAITGIVNGMALAVMTHMWFCLLRTHSIIGAVRQY